MNLEMLPFFIITVGLQPSRVIRIRPSSGLREGTLGGELLDSKATDQRFPTPDIFLSY